ncbi:unnamed protein product [Lampetra fluviatilis]
MQGDLASGKFYVTFNTGVKKNIGGSDFQGSCGTLPSSSADARERETLRERRRFEPSAKAVHSDSHTGAGVAARVILVGVHSLDLPRSP